MKVTDAVGLCPLFSELDARQRESVASVGVIRTVPGDTMLFEENDQGTGFYIVMDGFVSISKLAPDSRGTERTLAILAAGDFFGEMALLDGELRSARAKTLTLTHLVEFDREEFNTFLEKDMTLSHIVLKGLAQVMSRRIRATNEMVANLLQKVLGQEKRIQAMRHALSEDFTAGLRKYLERLEEEMHHQLDHLPEQDRESQTKALETFHRHVEDYSHSVGEMLTLVDLCYGEYQPQVSSLNVHQMVDTVLGQYRQEADDRGVRLLNKVDPLLSYSIDGRLRLAMAELIHLLIQHSLKGQCIEVNAGGAMLTLRIFPEGLEEGVLQNICMGLLELDESKSPSGPLGLGFALAKELIEAQGGKIEIRQDGGATLLCLQVGAVHHGS